MMKKILRLSLFIVSCYFFAACSKPLPNDEDLKRIQSSFLKLRFNTVLIPELRGKKDKELFELSCRMNRADCPKVLKLLKKKDPNFYKKLESN